RPGVLDDLGLGPALKTLTDDFTARTGMTCAFSTVVFRNRLDGDAKIALYRVAQEALTNIERHADASHVKMSLRGDRRGAVLTIEDNGQGLEEGRKRADASPRGGIGLRNMQERMEQLNGAFTVISSSQGTTLEARAPLSHMLPPEPDSLKTPQETEDIPS
ncbi:ATP-binding protein, partial [bacterium]|nr:ATP-binding protein [bacterium]